MLFSEVTSALSFERRNLGIKLEDARNNLIEMHLIQTLKNEFFFDLPLFSKCPATSINSYFNKMTLSIVNGRAKGRVWCTLNFLAVSFDHQRMWKNDKVDSCGFFFFFIPLAARHGQDANLSHSYQLSLKSLLSSWIAFKGCDHDHFLYIDRLYRIEATPGGQSWNIRQTKWEKQ